MIRFAGIGSRKTPREVLYFIREYVVPLMASKGATLLSGGALGADCAFQYKYPIKQREIYVVNRKLAIPEKGFIYAPDLPNWEEALKTVKDFHPRPNCLDLNSRKLIARNAYQVLGRSLKSPVKGIICWTYKGQKLGGTSQALRIAEHYNIPVENLGDPKYDFDFTPSTKRILLKGKLNAYVSLEVVRAFSDGWVGSL